MSESPPYQEGYSFSCPLPRSRSDRPFVLDAAMGTRLIERGLDLSKESSEQWNLLHPDVVLEIHRADVCAGSDGLTTNSFSVGPIESDIRIDRRDDPGSKSNLLARAVQLAREAHPKGQVFGNLGPGDPVDLGLTTKILAQLEVDAILIETLSWKQIVPITKHLLSNTTQEDPPIFLSFFHWGHPEQMGELARRLEDSGVAGIGINCVVGSERTFSILEVLERATSLPLLVQPSANLPGQPRFASSTWQDAVPSWLERGVRLIGGCCGTDDRDIAAIRRVVDSRDALVRETGFP